MATSFRIMTPNYADVNDLADSEFSSQDDSFPGSNIFNSQRRTKVWRSTGYFKVVSGGNQMTVDEGAGAFTVSVALGEYNSRAAFNAALANALNVSGDSLYTVSVDTLKTVIVSNAFGGTGIFSITAITAGLATHIGMTGSTKTGALSYTMDLIHIHEEEFVLLDMGVATNPDAFIAVGERNQSIQISPTAVIKIQGNTTRNFSSPEFTQTITYDDEVLSYLTTTGMHTEGLRYWRLSIVDPTNPLGYVSLGAIFVGNFLNPSRGRANFPLVQSYIDRSQNVFSEGGQSFSDIKQKTQQFTVTIKGLQKADIEEFDIFFNDVGTGVGFFVSMDSDAIYSSNKNRRIILCKFNAAPRWSFVSPDNFTGNLVLREEL